MNIWLQGEKGQCLYRLSAGLFPAEDWWHFTSYLFQQPSADALRQRKRSTVPLNNSKGDVDPFAAPKPHFMGLIQVCTSEPRIISHSGQTYEVLLCGNNAMKRIWKLLATGQIVIPLCAICCLFGDTGVSQQPAFLLFLPPASFLPEGAWCLQHHHCDPQG